MISTGKTTYVLAEPKLLPKGTTLRGEARYNNSTSNLANPDPTQTVRWGEQTWEEMMIGYYDRTLAGEDRIKHPVPAPKAYVPPALPARRRSGQAGALRPGFATGI